MPERHARIHKLIEWCFDAQDATTLVKELARTHVSSGRMLEDILFPNAYVYQNAPTGLVVVIRWKFHDGSCLVIGYDTTTLSCQLRLDGNRLVTLIGGGTTNLYRWRTWPELEKSMRPLIQSIDRERPMTSAEATLCHFDMYTVHIMLTSACVRDEFFTEFNYARRDQKTLWNNDLMRVYGSLLGIHDNPLFPSAEAGPFVTELFPIQEACLS